MTDDSFLLFEETLSRDKNAPAGVRKMGSTPPDVRHSALPLRYGCSGRQT